MLLYRQLLKHFSLNCYFRRYFPWCNNLFLYDFQWAKQLTATPLQDMKSQSEFYLDFCLVPRPHYFALPKRFGSRGPSENVSRPFASDTSPKWIDREGLGKRRTGTRLLGNLDLTYHISIRLVLRKQPPPLGSPKLTLLIENNYSSLATLSYY